MSRSSPFGYWGATRWICQSGKKNVATRQKAPIMRRRRDQNPSGRARKRCVFLKNELSIVKKCPGERSGSETVRAGHLQFRCYSSAGESSIFSSALEGIEAGFSAVSSVGLIA